MLAASTLGLGIDVSHRSGTVDWAAVAAAGYDFAFVKATEGVDFADPMFAAHWPEIRAQGLVRGAYHFYVTEDDPTAQARFFLDTVAFEKGDLAPVVDIELIGHGTEPGLVDRLHTWLQIVEQAVGVKPIIYTAPNFWNAHLDASFGDHPLWIAQYETDAPTLPAGWSTWSLWQYQGDATVPGVEKTADLNRVGPEASGPALRIPNRQ